MVFRGLLPVPACRAPVGGRRSRRRPQRRFAAPGGSPFAPTRSSCLRPGWASSPFARDARATRSPTPPGARRARPRHHRVRAEARAGARARPDRELVGDRARPAWPAAPPGRCRRPSSPATPHGPPPLVEAARGARLPPRDLQPGSPARALRTQDDKGNVRWTLFGASHDGALRAFWQSFSSADSTRFERVVQWMTSRPEAPGETRVIAGADEVPAFVKLLGPTEPIEGIRTVVTFQAFSSLPERVRTAYLERRINLVPSPGSLIFSHHPHYAQLARSLPTPPRFHCSTSSRGSRGATASAFPSLAGSTSARWGITDSRAATGSSPASPGATAGSGSSATISTRRSPKPSKPCRGGALLDESRRPWPVRQAHGSKRASLDRRLPVAHRWSPGGESRPGSGGASGERRRALRIPHVLPGDARGAPRAVLAPAPHRPAPTGGASCDPLPRGRSSGLCERRSCAGLQARALRLVPRLLSRPGHMEAATLFPGSPAIEKHHVAQRSEVARPGGDDGGACPSLLWAPMDPCPAACLLR